MEIRKPNRKVIFLSVVMLIAVVAGYYGYQGYFFVKTEDAMVSGDIYKIAPKVAGKLKRVQIDEGSEVQSGQIIAEQEQVNVASNVQLENITIRSPISGVILQRAAKAGEVVGAGNTIALVVDKRQLYVQANVEETEAGYIQLGQDVDIALDMYPGRTFTGTVTKIGEATQSTFSLLPQANAGGNFTKVTQRIPIKIAFTEGPYDFQPGLNAKVTIHVR